MRILLGGFGVAGRAGLLGGVAVAAIGLTSTQAFASCTPLLAVDTANVSFTCSLTDPGLTFHSNTTTHPTGKFSGNLGVTLDGTAIVGPNGLVVIVDDAASSNATVALNPGSKLTGTGFNAIDVTGVGGIMTVNSDGTITSTLIGIHVVSATGNAVVGVTSGTLNGGTQAVNVDATGGSGTSQITLTGVTVGTVTGNVVQAATGTGSNTVTSNVTLTSSAADGIVASATSGAVTVNGTGAVTGKVNGVNTTTSLGGNISVTQGGAIKDTSGTGVIAQSTGGNGIVLVHTGSAIDAGSIGINASSTGTGTVTVTVDSGAIGAATAPATGIKTASVNGATTVTLSQNLTSTGIGIDSSGSGTGLIEPILTAGTLTAGSIGINASQTGNGDVDADMTGGTLNATTQAIVAKTTGTGVVNAEITGGTVGTVTGNVVETASTTGTNTVTSNVALTSTAADGIVASATSGAVAVNGTGAVTGKVNGVNTTTSLGGNISVTQAAAIIGTTGAGIIAKSSGGNGVVTVNTGNTITGGTYGINASTTGTGNVNVTNASTVKGTTDAIFGSADPTGQFNITNSGTINGLAAVTGSNVAASNFSNSGIWNGAGGASTYSGNLANTGTINLQNGSPTDTVTIKGNYAGPGTLLVDVNLTGAGASDKLIIGGTASGPTTPVGFNVLANGFLVSPLTVVSTGGTAANAFSGSIPNAGLVTYSFGQSGNNWVISSNVNITGGASVLTSLAGSLSTVSNGFYQAASNYVIAGKAAPDTVKCGSWARGQADKATLSSSSSFTLNGSQLNAGGTKQDVSYQGLQGAADCGLLNIDGTGWNTHFGFSGGEINGTVDQTDGSGSTGLKIPFASAYAFASNGPFSADFWVRHDFLGLSLTNAAAGLTSQQVSGQSNSVAGQVRYSIDLGNNTRFTPLASMVWSQTSVDDFSVNGGIVSPGTNDQLLGRLGGTLSYSYQASTTLLLQPSASAYYTQNFNPVSSLQFLAQTAQGAYAPINIDTTGVRNFADLSAGLQLYDTTTEASAFLQGTLRQGDGVQGTSVSVGGRVKF